MPELTTAPTETVIDPSDLEWFTDVSETPDAINQITAQNKHNSFAASTTEVLTGTSVAKHVTPDALAALWEQGSDIASAATISVGEGGYFNVTGTTTITDIDFATDKAGRKAWLKFASSLLTITHNASTLILPTGMSIVTQAGDIACFVSEGSDVVRCIAYTRADGRALVGGSIGGATGSTDNAILRADGTGGATAQSSLVTIDDSGSVSVPNGQAVYVNAGNGTGIKNSSGFAIDDAFSTVGKVVSSGYSYIGNSQGARGILINKALTDGAAVTIGTISLPTLTASSGMLNVRIWAKDATDVQCRTQIVRWEAVNKGGAYTTQIAVVSEGVAASTGTLTATWSITTGSDLINIRVTADSSLTPITLEAIIMADVTPAITPV